MAYNYVVCIHSGAVIKSMPAGRSPLTFDYSLKTESVAMYTESTKPQHHSSNLCADWSSGKNKRSHFHWPTFIGAAITSIILPASVTFKFYVSMPRHLAYTRTHFQWFANLLENCILNCLHEARLIRYRHKTKVFNYTTTDWTTTITIMNFLWANERRRSSRPRPRPRPRPQPRRRAQENKIAKNDDI